MTHNTGHHTNHGQLRPLDQRRTEARQLAREVRTGVRRENAMLRGVLTQIGLTLFRPTLRGRLRFLLRGK